MEESKIKRTGTRQEVFEGLALKTTGGLSQTDLQVNPKTGKITSKKEMFRGQLLSRSMRALQDEEEDLFEIEEVPVVVPERVEAESDCRKLAERVEAVPEPPKRSRGRPKKKVVLEAGAVVEC